MSDGGKGSAMRPVQVSKEKFASNWDAIFGKKKEKKENVFFGVTDKVIEAGDIVVPEPGYALCSGSSRYGAAVVVSVEPYVMVSEEGDMRWSQEKAKNYKVVGKAGDDQMDICMKRFSS